MSVFIVDDQTAYSKPLANGVQANLKAGGVKVTRNSVNQKVTDFSALVSKIGDGVDVVYLPWQIAANGQIFGQQMKEQGKKAVVFGSDGLDSGDFKIQGAYISAFAPDIRGIKGNAAFIKGYGKKFVSNFGPPMYVATQAAIMAIQKACADGNATRAEVLKNLRTTFIAKTPLGGNLQFTAHGDVKGCEVLHLQARRRRQEDAGRLVIVSSAVRPAPAGWAARRFRERVTAVDWDFFVQQLVNGLTLGSVYALIALGYTMVYGILKLLNFAHGEVYMMGAFAGFGVLSLFGGAARGHDQRRRC